MSRLHMSLFECRLPGTRDMDLSAADSPLACLIAERDGQRDSIDRSKVLILCSRSSSSISRTRLPSEPIMRAP